MLTVPASFDEEARELTVTAAREAGIEKLTLLEEPAAAFYSWIANHLAQSQKSLFDGQMVLVCDVGGGTSDFTLIRVNRQGDRVEFTRTAVGKHLLLGGDNLDLTLGLAGRSETRHAAFHPAAQRSAPPVRGRQREACSPIRIIKSVEITVLGARIVADRRNSQNRDHARRGAGADARRFPAVLRSRRKAQRRKAQPVPRARPALRFRSRHHAPPGRISQQQRECAARRDAVQRRLLHPRDLPAARRRCHRALVRHSVR